MGNILLIILLGSDQIYLRTNLLYYSTNRQFKATVK